MIHARPDYMRFQDPALRDPSLLTDDHSPIASDEPVMLFRAKDKHFIGVLMDYMQRIEHSQLTSKERSKADDVITSVRRHIELAGKWQKENGTKNPDL
jgi:hypothetical protein